MQPPARSQPALSSLHCIPAPLTASLHQVPRGLWSDHRLCSSPYAAWGGSGKGAERTEGAAGTWGGLGALGAGLAISVHAAVRVLVTPWGCERAGLTCLWSPQAFPVPPPPPSRPPLLRFLLLLQPPARASWVGICSQSRSLLPAQVLLRVRYRRSRPPTHNPRRTMRSRALLAVLALALPLALSAPPGSAPRSQVRPHRRGSGVAPRGSAHRSASRRGVPARSRCSGDPGAARGPPSPLFCSYCGRRRTVRAGRGRAGCGGPGGVGGSLPVPVRAPTAALSTRFCLPQVPRRPRLLRSVSAARLAPRPAPQRNRGGAPRRAQRGGGRAGPDGR